MSTNFPLKRPFFALKRPVNPLKCPPPVTTNLSQVTDKLSQIMLYTSPSNLRKNIFIHIIFSY
jgi:hypothetical protein